jgi:hypothetical protein
LQQLIDLSVARKEGKQNENKASLVEVNSSLYVSLTAGPHARQFLRFYLESETHGRALPNTTLLYALYRTGLVAPDSSPAAVRSAALHYLGFVPVSADDAPYTYERATDEVVNRRHGSLRQPRLHAGIEEASPLGRLLGQVRSLRADLRFKEDGVNTVVTLARQAAQK